MIYLDYNATTPCDPEVVEAMLPYFTQKFGNAASKTHPYGWIADEAVEQARKQIALLVNATPQEVIFTSGSTEGCNLALKGVFEMYAAKGKHIITCATEHKAVLDTCKHLERQGAEITYLNVGSDGLIDIEALQKAIRLDTILIAVMYANNETGVIQPVKQIGAIARQHKVLFFTDATQAAGKVKIDVQEENIDILALSAHKFYGPKGVGALYIRRKDPRVRLMAQIDGGGHERGYRSGTLNVPAIVGLGKAAEINILHMDAEAKRLGILRNKLEQALLQIDGSRVNGNVQNRMTHVSNISFERIKAERLVSLLNSEIAFSVGSACTSASKEPSHVLQAMGLEDERIKGSVRLSLGKFTTDLEVDFAIIKITEAVLKQGA
ncbi:MAG: aminotransferase class V-fold PLP-dependent enzyme [Taibaiella sp.]|jgi:cysteine desulfurase